MYIYMYIYTYTYMYVCSVCIEGAGVTLRQKRDIGGY